MANLSAGYTFGSSETVTNTKLATLINSGSISNIVNADIAAGAAIAYSKLNLGGNIADGDISTMAAIEYSKLSLASSIKNTDLAVGVGTSASNIVALNGSAQLPAVSGALLTNLTASLISISAYGTSTSSSSPVAQSALMIAFGTTTSITSGSTFTITNLPFTSSSSYVLMTTQADTGTVGSGAVTQSSGSQALITNVSVPAGSNVNHIFHWFAFGS